MNRILTVVAVWAGWFIAMTVIGYVGYNIGNHNWPFLALDAMDGGSRWLIIRNALIAATLVALFFDARKHRRKVSG